MKIFCWTNKIFMWTYLSEFLIDSNIFLLFVHKLVSSGTRTTVRLDSSPAPYSVVSRSSLFFFLEKSGACFWIITQNFLEVIGWVRVTGKEVIGDADLGRWRTICRPILIDEFHVFFFSLEILQRLCVLKMLYRHQRSTPAAAVVGLLALLPSLLLVARLLILSFGSDRGGVECCEG